MSTACHQQLPSGWTAVEYPATIEINNTRGRRVGGIGKPMDPTPIQDCVREAMKTVQPDELDLPPHFSIYVQCVPHYAQVPVSEDNLKRIRDRQQPKTFIALTGGNPPVSPLFDSLAELYPWMRENGWVSDEYVDGVQYPWRVKKVATNKKEKKTNE